jgi:hypothetical protein
MKTIYTTLPIYNLLSKQCYERSKHAGMNVPVPIVCPRFRLPSFQWLDGTDGANHVDTIEIISNLGATVNITTYFVTLPVSYVIGSDVYFMYNGDTLNYLMATGIYYLKITMNTGHIYYSEWFQVDCVYDNLITNPMLTNNYDTCIHNGTALTTVVNGALPADLESDYFNVIIGETITVILFFTYTAGVYPTIKLATSGGATVSNIVTLTSGGLKVMTFVSTVTDSVVLRFDTTTSTSYHTSEILVLRDYSDTYLTLNFYNSCNLGDIIYEDGFDQALWFKSEPMEQAYPQEEEGVKNGEGRFVRTFARQVKKYIARTNQMPDYMVDVFNRLKLHSDVELIDLVGDVNDVYNLEVEHEWLYDDKYYAKIDLTFDYDEAVVMAGCCG